MMIDFDYLFKKYDIQPDGVLHLGANEGQEAEKYYEYGIKNVIWVEAIPKVFEKLQYNVNFIPGTITINACVSDVDEDTVKFKISNNGAQSSSFLELDHHKVIHPEVHYVEEIEMRTVRVDTLLKDFKIEGDWFLNADLQGSELLALRGIGDLLNKFKWVYIEVNKKPVYAGCALIGQIDEYLSRFGFERVETGEWVADSWTDAMYLK